MPPLTRYRALSGALALALLAAARASGAAAALGTTRGRARPSGSKTPRRKQPSAADVGGKLAMLDSGVPPDAWHTTTVADGLAQHRPMIVYFGQPGRCVSET